MTVVKSHECMYRCWKMTLSFLLCESLRERWRLGALAASPRLAPPAPFPEGLTPLCPSLQEESTQA